MRVTINATHTIKTQAVYTLDVTEDEYADTPAMMQRIREGQFSLMQPWGQSDNWNVIHIEPVMDEAR